MMIVILLALVSITQQAGYYYPLKASYWGSYQYKVAYANNSLIYGDTIYMPFTVPFAAPVVKILDISAVLATYELGSKNGIHFKITTPAYSSGSASFTLKVFSPSVFNYLRFFIVYNTLLAKDYFQIIAIGDNTPLTDTTAATLRTQTLTATTRLQFVGPGDTYNIVPMLSSIMLDNPNQIIHFDLNGTRASITNNAFTFEFDTLSKVSYIMVTFFILKTNLQPEEIVFDINKNYEITPSSIAATAISTRCSSNFNIPAVRYGTSFNQNCSIGIQKLSDDNINVMRRIDFDVGITGSGFSFCVNNAATNASGGDMVIEYASICSYKAVCLNSNEYYDINTAASNLCSPCYNINGNCTTCSKILCYTCITGYYPQNSGGSTTCLTCSQINCTICLTAITCAECTTYSYLSNQTCLTCTNIPSCLQCSSSTFCLDCVIGYGPDPNGTCRACSLMMTQCAVCSNFYTCSQCNSGYYVAVGGSSCSSCSTNITNCDTCAASHNCTGCKIGYFLYDYGSCVSCSGNIANCMRCDNISICNQCAYGYYLVSSISCASCTSVLTGCLNCTDAPNCVQCQLGYYLMAGVCNPCTDSNCQRCSSPITCEACNADFRIASNGMNCLCITGWPVTGVCVSVIGCTTAVKISNISTCIFCNNYDKFILSNSTCACQTGYKLVGTRCVISCGDGIILGNEECDDNNDVNGDGCSSTCLEELGYQCGYNGTIYKCVYTANFTIKLKYILRHDSENSGTFYFQVTPTTVNFNKMNLNSYLKLTITGRASSEYKANSFTYKDGLIIVDVDFEQDIQNLAALLQIGFDPSYFNTTTVYYSFMAIGTNNPLIISSLGSAFMNFKIASYIIVGLAAVILVASVALDKMIGIETVNTIQIIVFSKLLYVQNDLLLSNHISSMKYISGYNQIGKDWTQINQVPVVYRRLQYNSDYILNFQTGIFLMVISLIVVIIFYIYKAKTMRNLMRTKKGSIDQFKLGQQRLNQKLRFIYQRVIFVVACITLFDCIASVRIQSRCLIGESHYTYFLINLSTMIFSVVYIFAVLSYQVINIGKKHEWQSHFCSYADYYPGYYVFYIILTTPILVAGEQILGVIALSLLAGIVLANVIVVGVWSPYNHIVHNAAVIFNNVVVLLVLGITATMGYIEFDQSIQLYFTYALMGLLFIVEGLAVVRLYLAKLSAPKEGTKLNRLNDAEKELNKTMENAENQFLKNNTKRSKNRAKRAQQEFDQLTILKNRLKKQFNNQNEAILQEQD